MNHFGFQGTFVVRAELKCHHKLCPPGGSYSGILDTDTPIREIDNLPSELVIANLESTGNQKAPAFKSSSFFHLLIVLSSPKSD
jgi:hypothetical protein